MRGDGEQIAIRIGCFDEVRQIVHVPRPLCATKHQGKIVSVGIPDLSSMVPVLFTSWGAYSLPSMCNILVSSGEKLYAGGRMGAYTFVYPPGEFKRVFGVRGIYDDGKNVWYRRPQGSPTRLFSSPLLFAECDTKRTIVASHHVYAVVSNEGEDIQIGNTITPISGVGFANGRWYVVYAVPKELSVVVRYEDENEIVVDRISAFVVGNIVVATDYRGIVFVLPDGWKEETRIKVRCRKGEDDSLLVLLSNMVVELGMRANSCGRK